MVATLAQNALSQNQQRSPIIFAVDLQEGLSFGQSGLYEYRRGASLILRGFLEGVSNWVIPVELQDFFTGAQSREFDGHSTGTTSGAGSARRGATAGSGSATKTT